MGISLAMLFHWAGLVLWMGGAFAAGRVLAARSELGQEEAKPLKSLEGEFLFRACHPGMLLALASGGAMIALNPGYYLSQGWLIAKLAAVAAAVVLTVLLTRIAKSGRPAKRSVQRLTWWLGGSFLLVLLLALTRPF